MICDEPTRGIDEEAKREIHQLADFAAQGMSLDDFSEVPGNSLQLRPGCHFPGEDEELLNWRPNKPPRRAFTAGILGNEIPTMSSAPKQMEQVQARASTLDSVERLISRYGILIALVLIVLVLSVSSENFLRQLAILRCSASVSINGILAVGVAFVILTGGIDLSIGSVLAFAGMVGASLVIGQNPHAPITAVLAAMAVQQLGPAAAS